VQVSRPLILQRYKVTDTIFYTALNGPVRLEKMSKYFLDVAVPIYQSWEAETSIPLFDFGSELVLRAVLTTLLGPTFVHEHGEELVPMVKSFERDIGYPSPMFLPLWATGVGRRLLKTRKRWKELIEAEVVARLEDPTRCKKAGDYLSYLLTLDDAERYMDCYGEHIITAVTASHANSDGTFAWTLLHLLRNADLLAEYENEIRSHPPLEGRYPIKSMPFSEACLRETGRLYTNLVLLRWVYRDMVAPGGIIIPKGWLAASPLVTHRDPEIYPRPEEWDPHRFLSDDTATSYASKFRNHEFVQFGYGRHACLGEKLTHCLLRETLWPTLIDNYRVEVVDGVVAGEGLSDVGVEATFSEGLGTTLGEREVWIKVTKRDVPLSEEATSFV
jgi:sterol 14-demethylase